MRNKIWLIVLFLGLAVIAMLIPFFTTGFVTEGSSGNQVDPSTLVNLTASNNPDCNFANSVTTKDFVGGDLTYGVTGMKSGSVTIKPGCDSDVSALLGRTDEGNLVDVIAKNGVSISREKGSENYVLTSPCKGGNVSVVEVNGQKFLLRKGDKITINSDGEVVQGNFKPVAGEQYDLAGFSITPTNSGDINFDMNSGKPILSLPDGSTIEGFTFDKEKDFYDRFGKGFDIFIKGKGLVISDSFAKKLYGGVDSKFRVFDGELEFLPATIEGNKDIPRKFFALLPSGEKVSFPRAGVRIETDYPGAVPLVFKDYDSSFNILDDDYRVGDSDYRIERGNGFISLGDNSIYTKVARVEPTKYEGYDDYPILFDLSFDKGSSYAGFNMGDSDFFRFDCYGGCNTLIKDNQISFDTEINVFKIYNGPDLLDKDGTKYSLVLNGGQVGNSATAFNLKVPADNGKALIYGLSTKGSFPGFAFDYDTLNNNPNSFYYLLKNNSFLGTAKKLKDSDYLGFVKNKEGLPLHRETLNLAKIIAKELIYDRLNHRK